jgi:hypothetical protein
MAAGDHDTPNSWQSLAWCLERSHPESFARPEIQLHAQINSQTNINNTLVVSAEVAAGMEERSRVINEEIDQLLEQRKVKFAAHQAVDTPPAAGRVIDAEVVPDPITLPPEPPADRSLVAAAFPWRQHAGNNDRGGNFRH